MKSWVERLSAYGHFPDTETAKYCYSKLSRDIDDDRMRSFYGWLYSLAIL